jgi:hypothetical protein
MSPTETVARPTVASESNILSQRWVRTEQTYESAKWDVQPCPVS